MKKLILVLVLLFFKSYQIFAQGCSQCKLVAEQGAEMDENAFGSNINSGILYLMVIPYLIIMFIFRKQLLSLLKSVFVKK